MRSRRRRPSAAVGPDTLQRWVDDVAAARLPRRNFVARMAALGIAAPMASLMLADAGLAQAAASSGPRQRGGGGTLRLLFWQGPTLLNAHFATGLKDQEGASVFYEPLVRFGQDGEPVPVLAAELPTRANGGVAADGRSVTWRLKSGVRWHDGKPFSADDVVFTWKFATDPATAASTIGDYEGVKAFEKVDALTVRVVFDKPMPNWLRGASPHILPKHLYEPFSGAKSRESPTNLKPVGTGPYRFVEFRPGDLLRAELNRDYHAPNRPHFDLLELKGGGDAASAARAVIQTGEFDFAWNLQVEDEVLKRMESGGKGRVNVHPSGNVEFIQLNMADPWSELDGERSHPKSRHPILRDPAVREALSLLCDRKALETFVYGRTGVATPNILNNPAIYNSPNRRIESDVAKANALLDAAGWKRGAGGLREKDGRKLKLLFQTSINALRQKVQTIYKQACAQAGIEIEIKAVTPAVFFSNDVGNPDAYGKFHADLQMYANGGREPDPGAMMQWFVSWEAASKANKWTGRNRGRWIDAEYDRLYRASETELDPVKRAAIFIRMNDRVCNEHAVIPIVYRPDVSGSSLRLNAPTSGWDLTLSSLAEWHRT